MFREKFLKAYFILLFLFSPALEMASLPSLFSSQDYRESRLLVLESFAQSEDSLFWRTQRDWTVFQMWEACFNLRLAQHLALLHVILVVTNLKFTDSKRFKIVPGTIFCFIIFERKRLTTKKRKSDFHIANIELIIIW